MFAIRRRHVTADQTTKRLWRFVFLLYTRRTTIDDHETLKQCGNNNNSDTQVNRTFRRLTRNR